ncbi:hypothetical protein ACTXG6_15435 [Pseudonocardia sp. Cha107L01]|uniref:hypothetical protein n=1 Tax=Pseudonocardia sp. Cha107L01 TaxID=3457576 RepID=UPI00403ECE8E
MTGAVVLDADALVGIGHVEVDVPTQARHRERVLGSRPRQSAQDERKPTPRLHHRLSTGIAERQHPGDPGAPPSTRVAAVDRGDRRDGEPGTPAQRVDGRNRVDERQPAREVIGSARRRGELDTVDLGDLTVGQAVAVHP